ncbi:WxL protein peptidoglycan domain-containing protein [Streptomyces sp. NPDC088557]|uniref:WxL protein peptidoglycan domain-containing protein n=1 Tax=Streptomyces sp. NPDC088557 TaxID=3365867 RepID=UPI003825734B
MRVEPYVLRVKPYALLLSALLLLLGLAPRAGAAENGEWAVYPASARPGSRPYFFLTADPGATVTDRITVTNRTNGPLTFRLYGADAYNTDRDGGFAVRTRQERQTGAGAWITPEKTRITVPPRSAVTVPYTLTVPADADPGDHPGALVALDERIGPATGGTVAVGVQRAVAARVYLRVTGPTVPALAVEDITLDQDLPLVPGTRDGSALVSYTLHNRGNVTLSPEVALRAEGLFGRTLLARGLTGVPAELLPRQKIRLTARWNGSPQFDRGDITLTATAKDVRETGTVSFLAVPWTALCALLAAGAATVLGLRLRRRGTARRDPRTDPVEEAPVPVGTH